ncbi:MAG: hypothetical protein DMF76_09225 [Acidobacteria bacterium]|nr:MAG: hypothetical protein DMF76_09225 [Acidobacteriota bacterium]
MRKHGVIEYQRRRGEAQPHIQFVIDQAVRDRNLHSPADKAAAVEETLPFVRAVRNRIQRSEYFEITMDALRVHAEQRRELWTRIRSGASTDAASVQDVIKPAANVTVAEEKLLGLLMAHEELRKIVLPRLEALDTDDLATAPIFRALIKLSDAGSEINFDSLSEETAGGSAATDVLPRLIMNESAESFDESLATAESCLSTLRLMKLDRRIDELRSEAAEAERSGDTERRDRLAAELLELSKQRGSFLLPAA